MCKCVCVKLHWPRVKHAKKDPAGRLLIFIWLTLTVCAAAVAPRQRAPPFYVCACAYSCLFPSMDRWYRCLPFKVKARNPLWFDQFSNSSSTVCSKSVCAIERSSRFWDFPRAQVLTGFTDPDSSGAFLNAQSIIWDCIGLQCSNPRDWKRAPVIRPNNQWHQL